MFSVNDKKALCYRIKRFKLDCSIDYRDDGVITLKNSWQPFKISIIAQAFPDFKIADYGRCSWSERPDDLREHFYVELEPVA